METLSRVAPGSHNTLHYRIAVVVDGAERDVVNTFSAQPATLTIGAGDLAAPLEARLVGLAEGERATFELGAGEGFGDRRPELVRELSRATFDAATIDGGDELGDIVKLASPEGVPLTGIIRARAGDRVTVDFNHPLAGLPVRLSVQLIGIL